MNGPLPFFIKGAVIGFSIAAPVGPIGVLCIRQSIRHGRWVGLATGFGAATADAFYGAVAAFGITELSGLLVSHRAWLGIVGGLFLCFLGVRTLRAKPAAVSTAAETQGMAVSYGATFLLTLTNPTTILSFIAVFAGLGLAASPNSTAACAVVLGVFLGSAAWWLILSTAVASVRSRFTMRSLRGINISSGVVILAFGLVSLWATAR